MEIIDTYTQALSSYDESGFSFVRWKKYIDSELPELFPKLAEDVKSVLSTERVSADEYLSVLNGLAKNKERLEAAHDAFVEITKGLDKTVSERFGKSLDVVVVFYLGLCNGAGWVTEYRGKTAILLGMEKIVELNWCGVSDMYALICHELGHVYQKQYGTLTRTFDNSADSFLWQLFTEGAAMCFEQIIADDPEFYHQDKNGWKAWCDEHFGQIRADFARDLATMTFADQRYFGDWVDYHGRGDVGYYLGCRFVREMLKRYEFDEVICFDIDKVRGEFEGFK